MPIHDWSRIPSGLFHTKSFAFRLRCLRSGRVSDPAAPRSCSARVSRPPSAIIEGQQLKIGREDVVVLSAKEYERLAKMAEVWEPALPEAESDGNYSLEAVDVVVARGILRERRRLGLTQAELAQLAKIRVATLDEIEHGRIGPHERAVGKIDRALKAAHIR